MGTWNVGIFDGDIALDIKDEFEEAIEEGLSVKEATEQILESFEDELEDEDGAAIVYLALAALQIEKGSIEKEIKWKALEIIETEKGLSMWKDGEDAILNKRKSILEDLYNKLNH